jgi:hypothetical protein
MDKDHEYAYTQAEMDALLRLLLVAVNEADGWHDDSRGGPCESLNECRAALAKAGLVADADRVS